MRYIIAIATLLYITACNDLQTVKTGQEGNLMPSFNILLMDSANKLNTNNIPEGTPIILYYFSPICPYCRVQTKEMIADIESLANIKFYIFSSFPFNQIRSYYEYYNLKQYSNITVGQDFGSYFGNYFKVPGVPYMAIYNKNKRLKQVLIGKVDIKLIKDISLK